MRFDRTTERNRRTAPLAALLVLALAGCAPAAAPAPAPAGAPGMPADGVDPRVGLEPGWMDAEEAAWNMELIAQRPRPEGFFDPANMADFGLSNTDMAFQGPYAFVGSYNGFQIWNIADPQNPVLRTGIICPGGQGDLSVWGDLLFMSVEETRGRLDCGVQGVSAESSPERFRGVRVFDISDLDRPRQIAAVQTCRGSHTHTLVTDPDDTENLYVYVSGTSAPRPAEELAGCSALPPEADPETALFRIEVIQVPLAAPSEARIVSMPRIFADPETGEIAGLHPGGQAQPGAQRTAPTNQCHDITAYPAFGLAAGACSGNGILLDIRDPANPVRIEQVFDPNFAYWHSATFNNPATKIVFTDEWGGGTAPRCLAVDRPEWGANALFELEDGELRQASYYKLPAPQTATENCVAHNGSLVPVPGRDIMVQAWYQGGISVFDFTDVENPVEIAFFDRGPMSPEELVIGGYWSAYWYNDHVYGSEIGRGLDVFRLEPSEFLTENELAAARLVRMERLNPQTQPLMQWPATAVVARAYLDQLDRSNTLPPELRARLDDLLDRPEAAQLSTIAAQLEERARTADETTARRLLGLAETLRGLR